VRVHGTKRRALTRWLGAGVFAAALPLALVAGAGGAGVVAAGPESNHLGASGWSGLWMGTTTTTSTATTLSSVRSIIGASSGTAATLTGAGVGIALIDTGVAPVPGLPAAQIANGPDLSFESQSDQLRYLDTFGHGTHMAGIIVANDTATGTKGLAPKAKITSLKLGTSNGAVDVTQVIAAIDWVVVHRNDDPANPIKVLNLSYGTGGNSAYQTDPVQFAVEQAWQAGITVVVAAGNDGNSTSTLTNPATDPFVIAVGAAATKGTTSTSDDDLSKFTNLSADSRGLDLLAPGESIASLRVTGSNIDENYSSARQGETLFRGSGTSQAAAVTSAAVALLLQSRPTLTPDQVKQVLKDGATPLTTGTAGSKKLKELNVNAALSKTALAQGQLWAQSTGTGAIETARGTSHVMRDDVPLTGDFTLFGPFHSPTWAAYSDVQRTWIGGQWLGMPITGNGWTGTSFASKTWAAVKWPGIPWSGASSWADPDWSGRYWAGRYWAGTKWSGRYWASEDWSTAYWG
jgi:serine protease AprX